MTRDECINIIQPLFPADSQYLSTADIGRRLLDQARRDCNNWRHEPLDVLERYAQLCIEEEQRQQRQQRRNHDHGI